MENIISPNSDTTKNNLVGSSIYMYRYFSCDGG